MLKWLKNEFGGLGVGLLNFGMCWQKNASDITGGDNLVFNSDQLQFDGDDLIFN